MNYPGMRIFTGKPDSLIGNSGYDREQQNLIKDSLQKIRSPQQGENNNGDNHNKKNKTGSAPRMTCGKVFNILHRQFLTVFPSKDGLVFGSVIHVNAAHILHQKCHSQKAEENPQTDAALQNI